MRIDIEEYFTLYGTIEPFVAGWYWVGDPFEIEWSDFELNFIQFVHECDFFKSPEGLYSINDVLLYATKINNKKIIYDGFQKSLSIRSGVFCMIPINVRKVEVKLKNKDAGDIVFFQHDFDVIYNRAIDTIYADQHEFVDTDFDNIFNIDNSDKEEDQYDNILFPYEYYM